MITALNVGEEFTLFNEKHFSPFDGSYFEALEDNNGFMMATYLCSMEDAEKTLLGSSKIHARIIKDGNKVLTLIRYGLSPLIFEISFDPTLYKDERALQIAFDNHMVTFVTIERNDNTIQTLRYANFPMKLKQALLTAWTSAFKEENYSQNYAKWTQGLMQYSVLQLWAFASDVGYFGEKGMLE